MASYPSFRDQCRIRREIGEEILDIVEPHTKNLRWIQKITSFFLDRYGDPTSFFLWAENPVSHSDPTLKEAVG